MTKSIEGQEEELFRLVEAMPSASPEKLFRVKQTIEDRLRQESKQTTSSQNCRKKSDPVLAITSSRRILRWNSVELVAAGFILAVLSFLAGANWRRPTYREVASAVSQPSSAGTQQGMIAEAALKSGDVKSNLGMNDSATVVTAASEISKAVSPESARELADSRFNGSPMDSESVAVHPRSDNITLTNPSLMPSGSKAEKEGNAAERLITVTKGDTLWKIAESISGNGSWWKVIYDQNRAAIGRSANRILPGTKLVIPIQFSTRKNRQAARQSDDPRTPWSPVAMSAKAEASNGRIDTSPAETQAKDERAQSVEGALVAVSDSEVSEQ